MLSIAYIRSGHYKIDPSVSYVRAKVTFTRKHPVTNEREEYYAWGQPVFTDARADTVSSEREKHNRPDASDGK